MARATSAKTYLDVPEGIQLRLRAACAHLPELVTEGYCLLEPKKLIAPLGIFRADQ